jgi:N-acetylmuramoyl-L-alanine amidase-like protein
VPSEKRPVGTYLIMRGMPIDIGVRVKTWHETDLEFVGRPRAYCSVICAHWTGAENPAASMFHNMTTHSVLGKKSPLSVHFCIDQRGDIYQMADTEMRGAHAPRVNSFSVGIEFIGRGTALKAPKRGYDRERVTEHIQGRRVTYDELFDAQVTAGVALIEKLCMLYALPMKVPEDVNGNLITKELSDPMLLSFRGVIGHLHCQGKDDPGLKLLRAIQARGKALDRPGA